MSTTIQSSAVAGGSAGDTADTREGHDMTHYVVKVAYNGDVFEEAFPPTQVVQATFARAAAHFGVSGVPNLGLFFNGAELNAQATFAAQNVPSGSTVMLQPRVVRNGDV